MPILGSGTLQSVKSQWVKTEANEGLTREILVPLLIDDVTPPLAFRIAQTAKMTDWPDQGGQLDAVMDGITDLLGETANVKQLVVEEEKSIAVLPFVNMSDDSSQEYFSDGLSEDLIDGLVKQSKMKVIARTSSFSFKGKSQDIREIARPIGCHSYCRGSRKKSGQQNPCDCTADR